MSKMREAYELIKDSHHWTKGKFAADRNGYDVDPRTPVAERFCVLGAAMRTGADCNKLNSLAWKMFPESHDPSSKLAPAPWVNDNLGHAAVLQLLEKAIVQEEGSL